MEAVVCHVVAYSHVAVFESGTALLKHVRCTSHRVLTARDHDVELSGADQLIGQCNRVQTGHPYFVYRQGRHAHWDPGGNGGLSGGDLAGTRGEDLPVDSFGLSSRAGLRSATRIPGTDSAIPVLHPYS
jgi:hypothetical protein